MLKLLNCCIPIPVTVRGGPQDSEIRGVHIFYTVGSDGGEVVSLTRRPRFLPAPGSFLILNSLSS
jgi:hypothetical protein